MTQTPNKLVRMNSLFKAPSNLLQQLQHQHPQTTQHIIKEQNTDLQNENLMNYIVLHLLDPDGTLTDNLTQDEFHPQNTPNTVSSTIHTVESTPLVVPINLLQI